MTNEDHQFIDHVATLLAPWGIAPTTGRVYGYLLLQTEPISLDQIVDELELSKSTASVSARLLVDSKLAKRQGVRSSKRILFVATENYAVLFAEQCALLGEMGALMKSAAESLASGNAARRLQEMSRFLIHMRRAIEDGLQK